MAGRCERNTGASRRSPISVGGRGIRESARIRPFRGRAGCGGGRVDAGPTARSPGIVDPHPARRARSERVGQMGGVTDSLTLSPVSTSCLCCTVRAWANVIREAERAE
jgi:hypothetical protein